MWVEAVLLSWHSRTMPAPLKQPHLSFALMVYDPLPFPSSIHPHPQAYYQSESKRVCTEHSSDAPSSTCLVTGSERAQDETQKNAQTFFT